MELNYSTVDGTISALLHSVRTLLGMQFAFIAEFKNGLRVFRYVDSAAEVQPVISVGYSDLLEESYYQRVADGLFPELTHDAQQSPEIFTLSVTMAQPVGAHLSVPLRFSDGFLYGTFCCFSLFPDVTLNDRDIRTLRFFAQLSSELMEKQIKKSQRKIQNYQWITERLQTTINTEQFNIVYQPIVQLAQKKIIGYEALTRFSVEPLRSPDVWFNEAAEVNLQEALELATISKALEALKRIPNDIYISLNASPETILKPSLSQLLFNYTLERLMLEVTEHASINDYAQITAALKPLRDGGMRLAVDDAGAGYASFRHILKLQPNVIKLDLSLIRKIDCYTECRALAGALIRFAEETGSSVIAEGVETLEELQVLKELKVNNAQGYLLGRPMSIDMM